MIEPMRQDVSDIKTTVSNLENSVANLETSVADVQTRVKKLEFTNEHDIVPRLHTIEECYVSTYNRYSNGIDDIESIKLDVTLLKKVVTDHSEKLQKIS